MIKFYVNDVIIAFVTCKKLSHVINQLTAMVIYYHPLVYGTSQKKVTFCYVTMTTIRYIVKKLRLQYDVDTKLLRSCHGEATKRNYT